jgi:orotate phosphoribosyltransferase
VSPDADAVREPSPPAGSEAAGAPQAGRREALLLRLLEESGALCRGHFLLSSGRHSPAYVQCALLLEDPVRSRRVGAELAEELRSFHPDSVLSPALGGVIIGHEVAAALGVPFRFAERKGSELGLRRGFGLRQGERVVIVEDVVTTGRSTLETAALATSRGARVVAIGAIIDRSGGQTPFDVPFRSLMTLELPSYTPSECPQCEAGGSPEKPGSRPG